MEVAKAQEIDLKYAQVAGLGALNVDNPAMRARNAQQEAEQQTRALRETDRMKP